MKDGPALAIAKASLRIKEQRAEIDILRKQLARLEELALGERLRNKFIRSRRPHVNPLSVMEFQHRIKDAWEKKA